ncbi:sigma-70 family RNA polymerase sigma factor [Candidatus Peregrinibacteria bacterium]|nr:sigma-70 family RNA polymerase sigma factor [Candidatus Peregrinibacteria bacterium]
MNEEQKNERATNIEVLVINAQEGDRDAFSRIYDLMVEPVYKYVYYRVNVSDVEDIVENIFLRVWEHLRQYKPQKSFSAWVFRIAHNMIVDYYRASRDRDVLVLDPHVPDENRQHNPIKNTQDALHGDVLRKAIAILKKPYRDIIIYKFINELSNKEIADIMGKNEGSLRILQFRALKALKRELINMGFNVT